MDTPSIVKFHEQIKDVRDLLKNSNYKLMITSPIIHSNYAQLNTFIKKDEHGSNEVPIMTPRLAKYLCKAAMRYGPDIVKLAYEMSKEDAIQELREKEVRIGTDRINELIGGM